MEELPAVDRVSGAVTLRVEAIKEAAVALRDALPSQVVEQLGSGQRLGGQELEAPERLVERLVATGPTVTPPMHGLQAALWQRRAAIHHAEHAYPIRMPRREADRVVAAHRVADEGHPPPAERIHDPDQVRGELLRSIPGIRRPVALAVAPLIERDHVEPVNERRHHRVEPMGMGRASVQEAESRATGLAPLERTESHAVDGECAAGCHVTDERRAWSHARHCSAKKKLGLRARTS